MSNFNTAVNLIDMTGQVFGMLTVISRDFFKGGKKGAYWNCKCECGNIKSVSRSHLKDRNTVSCGCYHKKLFKSASITHNMRHTSEYNSYHSMKARCLNPNNTEYHNYGGRGITICEPWLESFEKFIKDMGLKPSSDLTLERRNNNLGYKKDNCYWATQEAQKSNRRNTKKCFYNGKEWLLTELCKEIKIHVASLRSHLNNGKPIEWIIQNYKPKKTA